MAVNALLLVAAFLLDSLFGDPQWFAHPVRCIGRLAMWAESLFRRLAALPQRVAGILAASTVLLSTVGLVLVLVGLAAHLHPLAGYAVSILLLYFALAPRDLAHHAASVQRALESGDLELARQRVAMMVGRDTAGLDAEGVARAAVESVAENCSDGVIAPLFYGLLFGPAGAWAYKSANTLDSMFGYRNERYREFGWASARFDDLVNWFPARLAVPAVATAAFLSGLDARSVFASVRRGAGLHESPNAGYPESAFAGALGIRLGGERSYGGVTKMVPVLGAGDNPVDAAMIGKAIRLMYATTVVFLLSGTILGLVLHQVFLTGSASGCSISSVALVASFP